MSFNYARSAATADRLVAKFGTTMTLTRATDSGTLTEPVFADTGYTITAVKLDAEDMHDGVRRHVARFVIAPTADIEPREDDTITDPDGLKFKLYRVNKLAPAGTKVLFEAYAGTK